MHFIRSGRKQADSLPIRPTYDYLRMISFLHCMSELKRSIIDYTYYTLLIASLSNLLINDCTTQCKLCHDFTATAHKYNYASIL